MWSVPGVNKKAGGGREGEREERKKVSRKWRLRGLARGFVRCQETQTDTLDFTAPP